MFEVNSYYETTDQYHNPLFLLVFELAVSARALFGVVYDPTFRIIDRRWFRVCSRGKCFVCLASATTFFSRKKVTDSSCIPPREVVDYFLSTRS